MFNSLRFRLIVSHVLILLICLFIIGLSLTFFLRSSIVIDRLDFVQLTDLRTTILRRAALPATVSTDVLARYAASTAKANDVRVLFADKSGKVIVDSAVISGAVKANDIEQVENPNAVLERGFLRDSSRQIWAFITQPIESGGVYFVLAKPRTTPLELLNQTVLLPLAQAAIVGIVLSVIMALLISYWVASPLQKAAKAASSIGTGDFDQPVPASGPDEVKSLAKSFNDMIARVKVSQQAQRDFVANISHELRTPLTSIQGFSQAILDGTASDPDSARRAANVIHDEAERMSRLVNSLLDLARLDAVPASLNRAPTDLGKLLNSAVEKLTLRAGEKNITMKVRIDPLPSMLADTDRLSQVFTNLLENAIKYTPDGGTVILTARAGTGEAIVSVADSGGGIPAEDLPRIFERFYRVDKARSGKGYGLGLAITKDIVQAHGGSIRVESALGSGTRFTVRLPAARSDDTTLVGKRKRLPKS
ncbi:MAG: HAMP domain-containing protein [Chloroflexi bacterium]|nr:HAMP domain-containing protein [Chloroflexota bacterium]